MKEKFKKVISFFLVLVLTICLLRPIEVIVEATENLENSQTLEASEDERIVSEEKKYRDEYNKVFRLENGNLLAVNYDAPIHFKNDSGKWEDFNNQLIEVESEPVDDNEESITNSNISCNTENSVNSVLVTNNSDFLQKQDISTTLDEPTVAEETIEDNEGGEHVEYNENNTEVMTEPSSVAEEIPTTTEDVTQIITEANTELSSITEEKEFKNKNSNQEIRLSKKAKKQGMVKIEKDDQKLSWGYVGINKSKIQIIKNNEELSENKKFIINQKAVSEAIYKNAFPNIDIQYFLSSNGIKENIILNNSDTQNEFEIQYKAMELTPILIDDNTLDLKNDAGDVVYSVVAPYMTDQSGEISTQLKFTLNKVKKNKFSLILTADEDWIKDSNRQFPVIIDPSLIVDPYYTNLQAGYISQETPDTVAANVSSLHIDKDTISIVKANSLPTLPSGGTIVKMQYHMKKQNGAGGLVAVREYTDKTINFATTTWNNRPTGTIIDYEKVQDNGIYTSFDITKLAYQWFYENKNYGFALERVGSETGRDSFYYYNFFPSSNNPYISIEFKKETGVPSNSDIVQNAGRAGEASISGYTGKVNINAEDIGIDGQVMPVNIKRIFDTSFTSNLGFYKGWRTNYHQQIYFEQYGAARYYYFIDENGVSHAFRDNNFDEDVIYDEDGIYELTMNSNRTLENFTIKEDHLIRTFNSDGFLTSITDTSQPAQSMVQLTYISSSNALISTITDGAGRKYKFIYGYNGTAFYVTEIQYLGTGTSILKTINYNYNYSRLVSVTYPDNEKVQYAYSGENITKANNIDDYNIRFTYNNNKLVRTREYAYNTAGNYIDVFYTKGMTTFTDAKSRETVLNFDAYGNRISTVNYKGEITYNSLGEEDSFYSYTKTSRPSVNLFENPSFEESGAQSSFSVLSNTGNATVNFGNSANTHTGNKALSITSTEKSNYQIRRKLNCRYGLSADKLTFSAWIKTSASSAKVNLKVTSSFGESATSENSYVYGEWTQITATITPKAGGTNSYINCDILYEGKGTVYIDDIQLHPSDKPLELSYIVDGDCNYRSTKWQYQNGSSYYLYGDIDQKSYAKQRIYLNGHQGEIYKLSASGTAPAVPTQGKENWNKRPFFGVQVFEQGDTNPTTELELRGTYVSEDFDDKSEIFDYNSLNFSLSKDCEYIDVYFSYNYNIGRAYIGHVELTKENTFDYSFGLTGVIGEVNNPFSPDDISLIPNQDDEITFDEETEETEDEYGRLLTFTNDLGITQNNTYDSYGNVLSTSNSNGTKAISTADTYTADGNYHTKNTDAFGKITQENVNANLGTISRIINPQNNSIYYAYDILGRPTDIRTDIKTVNGISKQVITKYSYIKDFLSKITHNGTDYNYTYTAWGETDSVSIGTQPFITYTYSDALDRFLSKTNYGNGQSVEYVYSTDELNHTVLTGLKYDGSSGNQITYKYNSSGELREKYDHTTFRRTLYHENGIKKIYDASSNIVMYSSAQSSENEGNVTYETAFGKETKFIDAYNEETEAQSRSYNFAQGKTARQEIFADNFGRVISKKLSSTDSQQILKTEYTCSNPSASSTSYRIEKEKFYYINSSPYEYTYTYNDNGDITKITLGNSVQVEYTYDHIGQLTQEDNAVLGKTIKYNYNNGGNFISKKEYTYKTNTQTNSINYAYGDANWKDKLTAYNGKAITYDQIGNPLTYDGNTYTWESGRRLAKIKKADGTTIRYTYDDEGIRTKKYTPTETTNYIYEEGSLVAIKTTGGTQMNFRYNEQGEPFAIHYNGAEYYYQTNIMGDVTAILDKFGSPQVRYNYDAWGNKVSTTGHMANTLGTLNPLRYRGYVYDEDTGLYYLQSRYYNPQWHRFLNADAIQDTGTGVLGTNMFAYCLNNPVKFTDETGFAPKNLEAYVKTLKNHKGGKGIPSQPKTQEVRMWIKGNTIYIDAYLWFKPGERYARQRIMNGIKEIWKGSNFTVFNYKKVSLKTVCTDTVETAKNRYCVDIYSKYQYDEGNIGVTSYSNPWTSSKHKWITFRMYKSKELNTSIIKHTAAHEFGHIMGIDDLYLASSSTKKYYRDNYGFLVMDSGYWPNGEWGESGNKKHISSRELSMMINAWVKNKFQKW